jgi:integrase
MKWDDKANQWRRDLGFKTTKSGAIGQHRFRFGADKKSAELAESRLVAFWSALEKFHASTGRNDRCLWQPWSLAIAQKIADGKINVEMPDLRGFAVGVTGEEIAPVVEDTIIQYFGNIVGFNVPAPDRYEGHGEYAPVKKADTSGQKLFMAIGAYVDHLHLTHQGADGNTNQTGKKQGERAERLKKHHDNCPLSDVDSKAIEAMLRYWAKRPLQADGKRYAKETCKNQMILIRAFLRWLHRSDLAWKLPTDFLFPRCKIEWLQEERSAIGNKKRTYTLSEVGILWKFATPLERAFMALALNCSFGEGEISTLAEAEISGKVIKRARHKTDVFGAWWMMPVTREAIEYLRGMKKANGFESPFLLVTSSGKTYDQPTKGNNKPGKIRNAWNRLLNRIRAIEEHKDFPKLSFGKLRKTSASWVRKIGGGELASIHIAHGKATGDTLLDVYANRQFKRLFNVHMRMWKKLKSVLVGAFPIPKATKPNTPTQPAKVKRILALQKQGFKLSYIAKKTDTPLTSVARIIRNAKKKGEASE